MLALSVLRCLLPRDICCDRKPRAMCLRALFGALCGVIHFGGDVFAFRAVRTSGHACAPADTETPVANAKHAIESLAHEQGFSLDTLTSSDHQLFLIEAEFCENNPACCICNGALEGNRDYILKTTAEGVKNGEGVVVTATIKDGIAAFTYITSEECFAEVEYVCQRPVNKECTPRLMAELNSKNKSIPKTGQLTFAMSLVEVFDGLKSTVASLEVADAGEKNVQAEMLYKKFCFFVTDERDEEDGTMMSNLDLAATVDQMPFLLGREKPCPISTSPAVAFLR